MVVIKLRVKACAVLKAARRQVANLAELSPSISNVSKTPGVINHVPFASLRELLRCKTSFKYFHWVGCKKFSLARVCPLPVNCNCGTHNSNLRTTILRGVPSFWKIISLSSLQNDFKLKLHRWQQPVGKTFEEGVSVQRDNGLNCLAFM